MFLLSQAAATQSISAANPVLDSMAVRKALAGAIIFGVIAFYHDLQKYQAAPEGAVWNWRATAARILTGAIGGALAGLGVDIAQVQLL